MRYYADVTMTTRWLTEEEQRTWRLFLQACQSVFAATDAQLARDSGLPHGYYEILVHLSEAPNRALRMTQLARASTYSKSRLSHAVARLEERGWVARLFRPLLRLVSTSWHLFPIGFLFALGFETASEISLFGLSAAASKEVSIWSIFIFPVLFAAGMTLVDTIDGVLMIGAYGWAYRNPVRKLFYNLTITSISVLVALVIGGIETLGLMAGHFGLEGNFWNWISDLSTQFGTLGYVIVAVFAMSWAVSFIVYHAGGYHRKDSRA